MDARRGLDRKEREDVEELMRVRAPVLYEIVRQEGLDELQRPVTSLWWSGIAAGLALSASVFSQGFLRLHLPDAPWRPLIENFGYCVGFVMVIMGGFQLFTEQTVMAILPLLSDRTWDNLLRTARLWTVVLIANFVGTFAGALFATLSAATTPEQLTAFLALSSQFVGKSFWELLLLGIPAGFLIAALTWMLPNAEGGGKFWVTLLITYVIALGSFSHVIAGSTEVFLLLLAGKMTVGAAFGFAILPTLIGNILGGTALFSVIAYGQVREEI